MEEKDSIIKNLKEIVKEKDQEIGLAAIDIKNLKTRLGSADSYISDLENKNTLLNEANINMAQELAAAYIKITELTPSTPVDAPADANTTVIINNFACDDKLLGEMQCMSQCDKCRSMYDK